MHYKIILPMKTISHLIYIIGLLTLLLSSNPSCAGAPLNRADANVCAVNVSQHERLKNIPLHLLAAISKVESGRYHPQIKRVVAWPWTINVQGKDHFFANKAEAVRHVKGLLAQGIKSIDVGCMQINLRHHPDAFQSIEDAFEPRVNIDYAAKFLTRLKNAHGSWNKAVAHYHSANAQYHVPYRKKVYETWLKERQAPSVLTLAAMMQMPLDSAEPQAPQGPSVRARIYRPLSVAERQQQRQTNPQWRLNEARQQLVQYRQRAQQMMAQQQALKSNTTKNQAVARVQPKRLHVVNAPKTNLKAKPVILTDTRQQR